MSTYKKPEVIAKNLPSGSYAAGCPANGTGKICFMFKAEPGGGCKNCERTL